MLKTKPQINFRISRVTHRLKAMPLYHLFKIIIYLYMNMLQTTNLSRQGLMTHLSLFMELPLGCAGYTNAVKKALTVTNWKQKEKLLIAKFLVLGTYIFVDYTISFSFSLNYISRSISKHFILILLVLVRMNGWNAFQKMKCT